MGLLFIHIIKSSLCLIAFYFSYKVLLSKETFYKANRFILISIIVVSALIPFFELTIHQPLVAAVPVRVKNLEELFLQQHMHINVFAAERTEILYSLLFFIYLAGAGIQLVITCINFIKISRLTGRAAHIPYGNYVLALTDHDQSPFSWGKYIVLSKKDYGNSPEIIIQHELVHLKRGHSLDLLVAELAVITFWFNPVIWLLKNELKDIHEFEVDDTLLRMGVDSKQYQLLLIKKAVGDKVYSIANSFNQSKLSIRIRMMLRQKSNPWAKLKYACIALLTFVSVIAFAKPGIAEKIKALSPRQFGTFLKAGVNHLAQSISLEKKSGPGTGNDGNTVNKKPLSAANVVSQGADKPAGADHPAGKNVAVVAGFTSGATSPLCIVDGKRTSYEEFQQIDAAAIKTVKVLKEKEAVELYGENGRNGAILITLMDDYTNRNANSPVKLPFNMSKPAYVFFADGKPLGDTEQSIFARQAGAIIDNHDLVESVIFITGKEAIRRYGPKGANGILEIYLKKQ